MEFSTSKLVGEKSFPEYAMGLISGGTGILSFFILKLMMKIPMKSSIITSLSLSILIYSSHQTYKQFKKNNIINVTGLLLLLTLSGSYFINELLIIRTGLNMRQVIHRNKIIINNLRLSIGKEIDKHNDYDNPQDELRELIRHDTVFDNQRNIDIAVDGINTLNVREKIINLNVDNVGIENNIKIFFEKTRNHIIIVGWGGASWLGSLVVYAIQNSIQVAL